MKEELISFETAKLAKQKGFNMHCNNIFDLSNKLIVNTKDNIAIEFFDGFVNDLHDCKEYRGTDAKENYLYKNDNNIVSLHILDDSKDLEMVNINTKDGLPKWFI